MVIDLTGVFTPPKDEPEKLYCKYCHGPNGGGVELLYCNHSKEDNDKHVGHETPGPTYQKGDYQCPQCGNVKTVRKTKEQKGPKLSSRHNSNNAPQGGIYVLSTNPDALDLNFEKQEQELHPEIEDEDSVYEGQGATIAETTTTYADGHKVTRKYR